jgi:cytochrome c5
MNKFFIAASVVILLSCNAKSSKENAAPAQVPAAPVSVQPPAAAAPAGDTAKYGSYCNSRFEYCVGYPEGVIYPQPESANGDGRIFENKKGVEVMRVFGRAAMNPDGDPVSLPQQFEDDLDGWGKGSGVITYQKQGDKFFVISGYKKDRIFYQKTILLDGSFGYVVAQYAEQDKALYDKMMAKVSASFKVY